METQYVYQFSEGSFEMRNLLGGKGATLADMTQLKLPIPQGFVVSTEACNQFYKDGESLNDLMIAQIEAGILKLESISGKRLGDAEDPLLVSVRSGARVSMPGMMDTVLNLGLNDIAVEGLAKMSHHPQFAYDSYRRFIQMFSDVVMGIDRNIFEDILDRKRKSKNVEHDSELSADDFKAIISQFKVVYQEHVGSPFPQDPKEQLLKAISAVFLSWMNPRAHIYRKMNGFSSEWGTAVNVQIMVFGNLGETSGSGVAFSRSPVDGHKGVFGEYLINAQGEDVVAGIRTPLPLEAMKDTLPEVYDEFVEISHRLETHYKDMQDMEFTIENGKLYILQSRSGKRTAAAALKIAVDMVEEGLLSKEEALLQIDAKQLNQLLHPHFDEAKLKAADKIGSALPASPGGASGKVYFTSESATEAALSGESVIMVREETSPEDIEGMHHALGILTARGGMTSHAAVVARGMGTPCVSGCGEIQFVDDKTFKLGDYTYEEGDTISIDGSTGSIYDGLIDTIEASLSGDFATIMEWSEAYNDLKVRANADSPEDVATALKFGATGIGLTRTEHMFFEADRILAMREMILASDQTQRELALEKLHPMQKKDFKGMFGLLEGLPITVRLLDPPLHEFLPQHDKEIEQLAKAMNVDVSVIKNRVQSLHELNPMMGHRGVRLAITYPEIAAMQTRALLEAALEVQQEQGILIHPEIMIPLIGDVNEFSAIKRVIDNEAMALMLEHDVTLHYTVGAMMEIPRATLKADEIAKEADFFSFGTNDLTQMTYGFSRDDAGGFLGDYYDKGIYTQDPFQTIDEDGVGELMRIAVERGRSTHPEIKLGICGEHGGDPQSVKFCHSLGLDYVSCSPYRIPIAKLAAAQAAIAKKNS